MAIKSEWGLLEKIQNVIKTKGLSAPKDLIDSIGDDCSVFEINDKSYGLITTDISIEERHFKKEYSSPEEIGYKAMIGNISDINAMGGKPRFAFISLGVPEETDESYIEKIYEGMLEAASPAAVIIAGGDISKSNELVLNIALYGEVEKHKIIKRRGANPGDTIYITGTPGDSLAGLEILMSYSAIEKEKFESELIKKHKTPETPHQITEDIIANFSPTSMIDISDGILSDLKHIAEKNQVGYIIKKAGLPVSSALQKYCKKLDKDPHDYILNSGEEYQLLFTSEKRIDQFSTTMLKELNISAIGTITQNGYYIEENGIEKEATSGGFDHFKEN